LHSKQEHGDARCEQEEPYKVKAVVKVSHYFYHFGLDDLTFWYLAEEYRGGDKSSRRQIDVKAPTPANGQS
jgi:hypothetical protein